MDISNAEFEVLEVIWQGHPCSATDIIERLSEQTQWHEKTIKTLLNRLVKKGALGFERQKRHYLYYPLIEREAYQHTQSKNLLEKLFEGRVSPLVASFANKGNLNKQDVDELKALIDQWEKNND